MSDPAHDVVDLIFGRWRSQILYAGAALGVFDHLTLDNDASAQGIADAVGADPVFLYRLLRALATIGLLTENEAKAFRLTAAGVLLRADHPQSLQAMALFEEGPEHYAIWKYLVPIVRDGGQNGFIREFGATVWEHARINPDYRARFNEAMTSYSMIQTEWVRRPGRSRFDRDPHPVRHRRRPWPSCLWAASSLSPPHRHRLRFARGRRGNRPALGPEAWGDRPLPLYRLRHVPSSPYG